MIKAKLESGNVIFGITAENVKRLKEGKPIQINMKELGLGDNKIFIMYGEDEHAILDKLGIDMMVNTQGNC